MSHSPTSAPSFQQDLSQLGPYLEGAAGADDARVVHGVAVVDVVRQDRALLRLRKHRRGGIGIFGRQVDVRPIPESLDGVSWERERFRKAGNDKTGGKGAGAGKRLTETGVLREIPQEFLAFLLHIPAAFAGAPGRDGDAGGAGVHVVGGDVKAWRGGGNRDEIPAGKALPDPDCRHSPMSPA